MKYNGLVNRCYDRRVITPHFVWWDNGFSDEEISQIEQLCDSSDTKIATTIGDNIDIRKSHVKFYHFDDQTQWFFMKLNLIIEQLNNQFFGFDINGYDFFQYTVYDSKESGKYDWHTDLLFNDHENIERGHDTRKLTAVLLLSDPEKDFTGGEFQINTGSEETVNLTRGKVILFPSFILHRVKPVLTGTRKSIVVWVEGPKFI